MSDSMRVVITGMGATAPNGADTATFWNSLLTGVSGVRRIRSFDVSNYPCHIGGEIVDLEPGDIMDNRALRRTGRAVHLAVASVRQALKDARFDNGLTNGADGAVIYGVGCPAIDVISEDVNTFLKEGSRRIAPYKLVAEDTSSVATAISEVVGARRLVIVVASGCTAGLNAIGLAVERIRSGEAKTVVTGSADAPLSPFSYAVFCASGMMSKRNSNPSEASRPFDLERDGGVLSEGAGALILESLESALARGATIYGEILGFASVKEKQHAKGNAPGTEAREAFTRCMTLAMADAKVSSEDIDYISAHAPSDPQTDRIETEAIKLVFGERAYRIPVSSIKACIGNPIAAAGVLQTIATLLSVRDGKIPPTINYEHADPKCDLDYVPNKYRYNRIEVALVNSHGLGGTYSTLVIGRFERHPTTNEKPDRNRHRRSCGV
jgi:3-oxoacyl-[acyl-carrier-protein] synthase II